MQFHQHGTTELMLHANTHIRGLYNVEILAKYAFEEPAIEIFAAPVVFTNRLAYFHRSTTAYSSWTERKR